MIFFLMIILVAATILVANIDWYYLGSDPENTI
jgi:hypothetical protein